MNYFITRRFLLLYASRCMYREYHVTAKLSENVGIQVKDKIYKPRIEIKDIIAGRSLKTLEDWRNVRTDILSMCTRVTPLSIDAMVMAFCSSANNYILAESYMNFIKQEGMKYNIATIGQYFSLFFNTNFNKRISKDDEQKIFRLYEDLRKTHEVLDGITCTNSILALSLTSKWRECLNLLREISVSTTPNSNAYNCTIGAAFSNNENEIAWNLLEEMIIKHQHPNDFAFISYLKQCEAIKSKNILKKLEMLFSFFELYDVKCGEAVALKICDIYKSLHRSPSFTNITSRGICNNCNKKLRKLNLSKDEYNNLKKTIFEKVVVGKDVFYKSTPEELEKFRHFITNMRKVDVVIDGLNVAYSAGVKQSPQVFCALLTAVVKYFIVRSKSVLILGRSHMKKWPQKYWSYIENNATVLLTENLSQDDPYILYCALNSGLNTIIVTRDLMRGHAFLVKNPQQNSLFKRWFLQNQYQVTHISSDGKVHFKFPLSYMRTAQKDGGHWHIPYTINSDVKWLCLNS